MITMIAQMRVKPECAADYEALLTRVTELTLKNEPGVAYYAWARKADEANAYVVIEVYENAEVHAAHMASPWVRESLPKTVAMVDGGFDIRQFISGESTPVALTMG